MEHSGVVMGNATAPAHVPANAIALQLKGQGSKRLTMFKVLYLEPLIVGPTRVVEFLQHLL